MDISLMETKIEPLRRALGPRGRSLEGDDVDGWTITLMIGGRLAIDVADALEVVLDAYGPALAIGEDDWRITLAIEGSDSVKALGAIELAVRLLERELGAVEVLGIEAITWTEHDRRLAGSFVCPA